MNEGSNIFNYFSSFYMQASQLFVIWTIW